jgi:hypothetical protein
LQHRAAIGHVFAASRRHRACICSIAPPSGAYLQHHAANGCEFQASIAPLTGYLPFRRPNFSFGRRDP